ncbi:NAD(P)-dependent alcohol dehydrogenase [Lactobacillus sp. ESL0791]|uniref:NAD(P)-dependent alcohol dehydrogenase n=1 Tax=Lactobacillus sp. ESL0791 TaxID=2983234 RepID=UPI0023F8A148|nr:NAD(P)-dependent alcohol dehydrogenase [Lactobacillus sp. ESL0791]MDF7638196.1 NAD(P)-dependent alcohol dehydrogenase [Lactobacillus sp. ESL0791]
MKIKAAVLNKPNQDLELENIVLDEPKSNEVLIKTVASGICHSDIEFQHGGFPVKTPLLLGHEGAGIVEKVGSNVTAFKKGDHVAVGFASDGTCKFCRAGLPGSCVNFNQLNTSGGPMGDGTYRLHKADGTNIGVFFGQSSFGDHIVADQNNLVKVPDDLDLRLAGPLGCGYMTGAGTVLNSLKPEINSNLVVLGTGSVGLAAIMAAAVSNCKHVIAVDKNDERLKAAKLFGATDTINNTKEDIVKKINEIVGSAGLNYAVDTTGEPDVIKAGISALTIKGQFAVVAMGTKSLKEISPMIDILTFSRTIKGVIEGDAVPQQFIPELIDFYRAGKFPIDKITKFYKPEQINQAIEDSLSGTTIKPVIVFDDQYQA